MSAYLPLLGVLFALLIGLVVGKAWERYKLRDGRWIDRRRLRETPHYMLGLNFLVDNQVDQAIDELTQATSIGDTDALELQMILGNLYRAKGQVRRAINVHQALLQRPDLTKLEQAYVQLCLALDFRHGGFVDRPPEAFQEVVRLHPKNRDALVSLQQPFEEQHQWRHARRSALLCRSLPGARGPESAGLARAACALAAPGQRWTLSPGTRGPARRDSAQPSRARHSPADLADVDGARPRAIARSEVRHADPRGRLLSGSPRLRALSLPEH